LRQYLATGAPLVAGRDIRALSVRAPERIGLIRAFLVLFQKIDSPQRDVCEMLGFPQCGMTGPQAGRQVSNGGPGGERP
jgi:hypothetical protein